MEKIVTCHLPEDVYKKLRDDAKKKGMRWRAYLEEILISKARRIKDADK